MKENPRKGGEKDGKQKLYIQEQVSKRGNLVL